MKQWLFGCVLVAWLPTLSFAGFEIGVAPSRFELDGKSGQRIGQTIDIHNVGRSSTEVSLRTLDWKLAPNGNLTFHDELLANSCRSWVSLERQTMKIPGNTKGSFRFQVNIPANAPRTECRFMIAAEGVEPATKAAMGENGINLSVPVSGRMAVTVYLAVNGAMPDLEIKQMTVANQQGKRVPALQVSNKGDAHGRLNGVLDATDAKGQKFELEATGAPVMPGQTQTVLLAPFGEKSKTSMAFPVTVKGLLEWGDSGIKIENTFK